MGRYDAREQFAKILTNIPSPSPPFFPLSPTHARFFLTLSAQFIYSAAAWYADSLDIDLKNPFYKNRHLEKDPDLKLRIENTMRLLSCLGGGTMLFLWYVMLLIQGYYPLIAWKAFIVFQLTVVNAMDSIARYRCIRLKLHKGDINELKSVIPFVFIGLGLCWWFDPRSLA